MIRDVLHRVELFHRLSEEALARLAERFVERPVSSSEVIFREGEVADAFYVIAAGRFIVFRDAVGKPIQLLARLTAGDVFGEVGLFDDGDRAASVRAVEPGRLLTIGKRQLLEVLDTEPVLAVRLQMIAARRHSENAAATLELGQRGDLRIRVDQAAEIETDDGERLAVALENLSTGGLCLSGVPPRWRCEQVVRFGLRRGDETLPVAGRVVWRSEEAVGIAFTGADADHESRVLDFLRRLRGEA